ncbi:Core trichothecene cluster (CTC) protein 15 [Fusarium oxysporum f. sp. albedinis]|nr:Core trichothecene cluster (CTC) protein 15 [Fusarium oxysporum f. sp. albedinis]
MIFSFLSAASMTHQQLQCQSLKASIRYGNNRSASGFTHISIYHRLRLSHLRLVYAGTTLWLDLTSISPVRAGETKQNHKVIQVPPAMSRVRRLEMPYSPSSSSEKHQRAYLEVDNVRYHAFSSACTDRPTVSPPDDHLTCVAIIGYVRKSPVQKSVPGSSQDQELHTGTRSVRRSITFM